MTVYYAEIVLQNVTDAHGTVYDKVTFYELGVGAALHKAKLEQQIQTAQEELPENALERKTARLARINPLIEESAKITGPICDYFFPPGKIKKGYVLEEIPPDAVKIDNLPDTNRPGLVDIT